MEEINFKYCYDCKSKDVGEVIQGIDEEGEETYSFWVCKVCGSEDVREVTLTYIGDSWTDKIYSCNVCRWRTAFPEKHICPIKEMFIKSGEVE